MAELVILVAGKPGPPVVYYIRRGDLVKIGYTTRYVERMRALGPDALLAIEPGGAELEAERHAQFAEFRVLGCSDLLEWFGPAPELLMHAADLAQRHGLPPLPAPRQRLRRKSRPYYEPARRTKLKQP